MSDWIKWEGGDCPVGKDVMVDVKFRRGGSVEAGREARCWSWIHVNKAGDIVEYMVSAKSPTALGVQVAGDHYLSMKIQPIEFIFANNMDFLQGSVIKYISRHELKGGKADVEKAIHFCKLILALQYGEGK